MQTLLENDEATVVGYLDNVKLQFDVHNLVLVHGNKASVLSLPGAAHDVPLPAPQGVPRAAGDPQQPGGAAAPSGAAREASWRCG